MAGLVRLLRGGGGGSWSPRKSFWGGAEKGSKGHTLISSVQMSEILPPTISKGGGAVHVHKAQPPPPRPVPVAGNAGTCRNNLPEHCDSVRLDVLQFSLGVLLLLHGDL